LNECRAHEIAKPGIAKTLNRLIREGKINRKTGIAINLRPLLRFCKGAGLPGLAISCALLSFNSKQLPISAKFTNFSAKLANVANSVHFCQICQFFGSLLSKKKGRFLVRASQPLIQFLDFKKLPKKNSPDPKQFC